IEKGGNYGWSFREGTHKFPIRQDAPPEGAEFIDPIIDYSHADGISITGGVVYHGKANPGLAGYYLYGDWGSGKTWALKLGPDNKVAENTVIYERPTKDFPYKPAAYCLDQNGEILVLSWADKNPGQIYEIRAKK
ncbi:MAG: glucose sorbosone dehydrogenase, partial [Verrucomicrobiales bacterium]